jgi:hypothetical protein
VDNGKILAITGNTPDGAGVQQVTSWQQARALAGDRPLTYGAPLAAIQAVIGAE